jgi:hypothetical protein
MAGGWELLEATFDFHPSLIHLALSFDNSLKLEVVKTVRVPLHYALTKRKLLTLEHLTARLSYCVHVFSKLIEERDMRVDRYGEFTGKDIAVIKDQTKLGMNYVQQCGDKTLWMWRSYHSRHED